MSICLSVGAEGEKRGEERREEQEEREAGERGGDRRRREKERGGGERRREEHPSVQTVLPADSRLLEEQRTHPSISVSPQAERLENSFMFHSWVS